MDAKIYQQFIDERTVAIENLDVAYANARADNRIAAIDAEIEHLESLGVDVGALREAVELAALWVSTAEEIQDAIRDREFQKAMRN